MIDFFQNAEYFSIIIFALWIIFMIKYIPVLVELMISFPLWYLIYCTKDLFENGWDLYEVQFETDSKFHFGTTVKVKYRYNFKQLNRD